MSTLQHISLDTFSFGKCHSIWSGTTTDPLTVHRAAVHVKLAVHRYPINTSHLSKSKSAICPCCKTHEETMTHFLIQCRMLRAARLTHLNNIRNILQNHNIVPTDNNLVQAILDPTAISQEEGFVSSTTAAARSLCFYSHLTRLQITNQERLKTHSAAAIKRVKNILTYRPVPQTPTWDQSGAAIHGRDVKTK